MILGDREKLIKKFSHRFYSTKENLNPVDDCLCKFEKIKHVIEFVFTLPLWNESARDADLERHWNLKAIRIYISYLEV